jgi:hypothetical protein
MSVSYQVRVDSPAPLGLSEIANTVGVTSDEQPEPFKASVANPLPAINLGDFVWYDNNADGVQDPGEPGFPGITVYLYKDLDGDGVAEPGGDDGTPYQTQVSAANGAFLFSGIQSAAYFVDFEQPGGYGFSAANSAGEGQDSDADPSTGLTAVISLHAGDNHLDLDAGLVSNLDYGDLPVVYNNTLRAENGARHILGSLHLGAGVAADLDGQESVSVSGDTFDDGVDRGGSPWTNDTLVDINLDLQGATASGLVDVGFWIDWNGNGVFAASDFFPFSGLAAGAVNTVQISVPASGVYTVGNPVNVRVRAFDPASLPGGSLDVSDHQGLAANGEVEDYQWHFRPTAVSLAGFRARSLATRRPGLLEVCLLLGALAIGWVGRKLITRRS